MMETGDVKTKVFTKYNLAKFWTVCVMFFVNLLNYMDRYTIAGIMTELQNVTRNGFNETIDDTEGGLLQTTFIISFMLLSPIFGYLGDRFTRKYIMAVGIFVWSGFVFAGSFSINYPMLLATRSLVGVGEASYATIAPTIIADLFTTKKRLRVLSLFYMAIPIGSAIGYGAGSFVSSQVYHHYHVDDSWRWALRLSPGLGLISVFLILFTIHEPPRGHSEDPRNHGGVKAGNGFQHYFNDLLALMRNRTFLLSSFGFAALTFSVGALAQWAPTYVLRMSRLIFADDPSKAYTESQASLGFGIVTVIAGLVGTVSGSELSKFISRWTDQADCIVCALGLLVGSPLMYCAITFGAVNIYLGWVLVFIAEFFFCIIWAPVGAILLYVVIPECRSTAEAIQILMIHLLGDASSPFIIGAVSDALVKHFRNSHDEVYSQATGMQYSLYITVIVAAIGGGTFLISTLTVIDDRKAVIVHVKNKHTRNPSDTSHQSLRSDVDIKCTNNGDGDDDDNDDNLSDEKSPLVSNGLHVSINS
ncbi:PREDICTED: protein spinster homolog 1-like [Amphimedon queenslandica]|uniref:Major facilitator superfamily (MFS) profile domain-containing protein n=1 Tax=Amphimedon queenslandica TaxID=400682 RepID=A0A1X7VHJ5_AMPQE|nr:PREDICTED: protein spinster homolog 1-like [Amphimedon queenslandica]|eukprot:XP_019848762.1 PREDICTED: protein spinster homolog 1-like [Amphimedon queenslandica]